MGLLTPSLFLAIALAVRNLALVDAFEAREVEIERRRAEDVSSTTKARYRARRGSGTTVS